VAGIRRLNNAFDGAHLILIVDTGPSDDFIKISEFYSK
jgi:hypothetical protein